MIDYGTATKTPQGATGNKPVPPVVNVQCLVRRFSPINTGKNGAPLPFVFSSYFLALLILKPAKPTKPVPKRSKVAGSGTAAVDKAANPIKSGA